MKWLNYTFIPKFSSNQTCWVSLIFFHSSMTQWESVKACNFPHLRDPVGLSALSDNSCLESSVGPTRCPIDAKTTQFSKFYIKLWGKVNHIDDQLQKPWFSASAKSSVDPQKFRRFFLYEVLKSIRKHCFYWNQEVAKTFLM